MIISANIIKKPRAKRKCNECGKVIDGLTLRLFGAAFYGDSPYAIFMHPDCCLYRDPKIIKAKQVEAGLAVSDAWREELDEKT